MYGPAGAGKTAIAQTIAELCAEKSLLAASFLFSRNAASAGRNDASCLVATIAWQLIRLIPEIREHVLISLERDPSSPSYASEILVCQPFKHDVEGSSEPAPKVYYH
jgi:cytidylate kinase